MDEEAYDENNWRVLSLDSKNEEVTVSEQSDQEVAAWFQSHSPDVALRHSLMMHSKLTRAKAARLAAPRASVHEPIRTNCRHVVVLSSSPWSRTFGWILFTCIYKPLVSTVTRGFSKTAMQNNWNIIFSGKSFKIHIFWIVLRNAFNNPRHSFDAHFWDNPCKSIINIHWILSSLLYLTQLFSRSV